MVRIIGLVVSGLIAVLAIIPLIGIPFQIITLTTALIKLKTGERVWAKWLISCGFIGALLDVICVIVPFEK